MVKLGKPITSEKERSTGLGEGVVKISHSKHGVIAGVKPPKRRRNKTRRRS